MSFARQKLEKSRIVGSKSRIPAGAQHAAPELAPEPMDFAGDAAETLRTKSGGGGAGATSPIVLHRERQQPSLNKTLLCVMRSVRSQFA
jgi:hypothetical protein